MTTTIETDLKDILIRIDRKLETIDNSLVELKLNQSEIKGNLRALDERLSGQIHALDEKLSGQISSVDEKLSGQISSVDERLSGQISSVDQRLSGQINAVDEKLSGKVNVLDEKVTGFGKRLENQEFINRSILAALIIALIAGAAKLFGVLPNP